MSAPTPGAPRRLADAIHSLAGLVVRGAAYLAPRGRRHDWTREWRAELWHARRLRTERGAWSPRSSLRLLGRSLGSIPHALSLRARPWRPRMLAQDIRFAVRTLLRSPGFTAVTVLTLALGIGAISGIFSVLDAVVLRPLAFEESNRLVNVWATDATAPERNSGNESYADYEDYRQDVASLEDLAAWTTYQPRITGSERSPARLQVALVTNNLMEVLRIGPALGRDFEPADDRMDAAPTVILSHVFWRGRFDSDPGILGRDVLLDDTPHTVIGVLPPDYGGGSFEGRSLPPTSVQAWVALAPYMKGSLEQRGVHSLVLVGRLRPGVTPDQASEEVAAVATQLEATYPETNRNVTSWVQPVRTALVGDLGPLLLVLLGAVGLVLLIACANVANLMLSRATNRSQEIALRKALGANQRRIVRQLLTESTILALLGALAGLLVARLATASLVALSPAPIPRIDNLGLDGRVLGFTVAAALGTGLLFGLAPALRASRTELRTLSAAARGTADLGTHRLRQGLVVAEVALTVLLVVGSGLLLRTFWRLQHADPGFDPHNVLAVRIQTPLAFVDPGWPRAVAFFADAQERVRALPGVIAASGAFAHPADPNWTTGFTVAGQPAPEPGTGPEANFRPVLPGYFETMGIPLLRGREFTRGDDADAPGVVIVNRSFAEHFFPDEDPIGQRLRRRWWWGDSREGIWEIVGVVEDVPFLGPAAGSQWATYLPQAQVPVPAMTLLVRTAGDPLALAGAVRDTVWEIDPSMPVDEITTMRALLDARVASPRFNLVLLGSFAALALMLAAVGVYGVLSYAVGQRAREIGIRLALGAETREVVGLVVTGGVRLAVAGTVLGLGAALLLSSVLDRFLQGVGRNDPLTLAVVAAFVLLISAVASLVPAWRAARLDPVDTLKDG